MRRYYYTTLALETLRTSGTWSKLTSVGLAISYRAKHEDDQVEPECRYYILSVPSDAKRFARATRLHWGIENSLHWVLDVTFREDDSRIRKGNGPEIASMFRKLALNILQRDTTLKSSIRGKRLQAGWNNDVLEAILAGFNKI